MIEANNDVKVLYFAFDHPLVQQAAQYAETKGFKFCLVGNAQPTIPDGRYAFALYRWSELGINTNTRLVPVCDNVEIEEKLLELIQNATEIDNSLLHEESEFTELDTRHYQKWSVAKANHIDATQLRVEHQRESLTISHQAQCSIIEDQIQATSNEKIKLMRESQLKRTQSDFDRKLTELQNATAMADIVASPVILGTLVIDNAQI